MKNETAAISADIHGEKLYQQRAREALPVLVRQAFSGKPIFYKQLADELGMQNPRNLNFVLGSVGKSLIDLGQKWSEKIPPIQCLVINRSEELPGDGFGWFMKKSDWKSLSKRKKNEMINAVMHQIFAYPKWRTVLKSLGLDIADHDFSDVVKKASEFQGGGESNDHKALKEYVRCRPELFALGKKTGPGLVEKGLPSGDRLDVFFDSGDEWVAVEVKSTRSNEVDIVRGLFQCVKYDAVLNAMIVTEQRDTKVRAVLVLECSLPDALIPMKHMLGVEVLENVSPRRNE
ncbi:hypothetical protein SAMN05421829_102378 [Aromatoleum tolulyticum]|uniref:Uncharacterized protein n=1 Tax=Aromatoleum tolulyticum TaxID=34027 RepID=A0A1N6Q768_9RHOO|nr:hypothetical protein [Aromatoleum tolulyticum]SIQ12484.1 hypothetical protein SAMN05421829_102378 [Aromatoleum tolulyticum]